MLQQRTKNPFQYLTPDQIEAQEALNLFVDVFKDYYQILNPGNSFIHGPRGSGKSMMFRIMMPDCQMIKFQKELNEIEFYSVLIPIKDTALNITELQILEQRHGASLLNEHYLVIYFTIVVLNALSKEKYKADADLIEALKFGEKFLALLKKAGHKDTGNLENCTTTNEVFVYLREICSSLQSDFVVNYLSKLICGNDNLNYLGPLCLYQNFLFPLLKEISEFSFLPSGPLYLLVDDADELNLTQTKILNSWVSLRSSTTVCFKISTQLKYLTYFTTKGSKIDSPHDYFEISLNQVYTSESRERYLTHVKEIVEKRLSNISGIQVAPANFFPENEEQKQRLEILFNKLRKEKMDEVNDEDKAYHYAYRNCRPEYMTTLSNQYTFSYAGFQQLVHLSSGIIRNFLDLSAKMFTSEINRSEDKNITSISVSVQDDEIRKYSYNLLSNEFEKLLDDKGIDQEKLNKHKKLRNLIEALGKAFRIILESKSSERRKFSFYFDHELSPETREVLKLGEIYGYFHVATLSAKSGYGRSKLYVLNRMLAPYYKLDPVSFSGYLHLNSKMLELAINKPNQFIRRISSKDYQSDIPKETQLEFKFEDFDINLEDHETDFTV